jgi:hypothetical protein
MGRDHRRGRGGDRFLAVGAAVWACARRRREAIPSDRSDSPPPLHFVEHRDDETLVTYADSTTVTCEALGGPALSDVAAFRLNSNSNEVIFISLL